jgi:hypothetical protein
VFTPRGPTIKNPPYRVAVLLLPTLIGSQFFECIGLVKSLKMLADANLDSQSVTPTPHFAIALSFSRMAFEMNLK